MSILPSKAKIAKENLTKLMDRDIIDFINLKNEDGVFDNNDKMPEFHYAIYHFLSKYGLEDQYIENADFLFKYDLEGQDIENSKDIVYKWIEEAARGDLQPNMIVMVKENFIELMERQILPVVPIWESTSPLDKYYNKAFKDLIGYFVDIYGLRNEYDIYKSNIESEKGNEPIAYLYKWTVQAINGELEPVVLKYKDFIVLAPNADPNLGPEYPSYIQNAKILSDFMHDFPNLSVESDIEANFYSAWLQGTLFSLLSDFTKDGDEGGEMLKHYLENTGDTYEIDFAKMNSESNDAKNNKIRDINNAIMAAEAMCKSDYILYRAISEKEEENCTIEDNLNWKVAVHNYRTYCYFTVEKSGETYTMHINYYMRDFYDWDKDNEEKMGLISQSDLWKLNACGVAKTFYVEGCESMKITWKKGERYNSGAIIE